MIIRPRPSGITYGVRFGNDPDITRMPRDLAFASVETARMEGRTAVVMVNAGGKWAEWIRRP